MADNNKPLKTGYTTGSCATAATAAALEMLINNNKVKSIEVLLPKNNIANIKVEETLLNIDSATSKVKKYSGDDPDITNGAIISSTVKLNKSNEIKFFAGKGVGIVTKPGLQIPVGEPAINPVPRKMINQTVKNYTNVGVDITISVEKGEELAKKTFNPKLGIIGGISIIGTTGIVRPFSHEAIQETVKVNIDVATASGHNNLILVAGHFGMTALKKLFKVEEETIIEVSNEWDTALTHSFQKGVNSLLILSHPGKLAKFIDGYFNTHSKNSPSALPIVHRIANELNIITSKKSTTVDGLFKELTLENKENLANYLAHKICQAAKKKSKIDNIHVVLIDMHHNELGNSGGINICQKRK